MRGELPSHRVCESERTVSFLDLFPAALGHTLIVTRDHYENIYEIPPEVLAEIATESHRVAGAQREALRPEGLGVYQLNGAPAGQTVFHYHMHLIPRMPGQGLELHGRKEASSEELSGIAAKIAAKLPST